MTESISRDGASTEDYLARGARTPKRIEATPRGDVEGRNEPPRGECVRRSVPSQKRAPCRRQGLTREVELADVRLPSV